MPPLLQEVARKGMSDRKNAIICYTGIKQVFFIEIPSGIFRPAENQIRYRLHSMRNATLFAYHLAARRYNPDELLFANNYITEIYNLPTITAARAAFAVLLNHCTCQYRNDHPAGFG
jgi:hypothetical protein